MEAMWTRFLPLYGRIREWLDAGRIGRPQLVSSAFCNPQPRDPSNRFFNPALAGGGLLDLGVYNLSISQWVLGRQAGAGGGHRPPRRHRRGRVVSRDAALCRRWSGADRLQLDRGPLTMRW